MEYAEVLEAVYQAYESCLDLDVAMSLVAMTSEDRIRLADDPDLRARIAVCDARMKEDLVAKVRVLSTSSLSDGVRLQALKELGRTLYPKRFKEGGERNAPAAIALKRRDVVPEPWPEEYVAELAVDMLSYVDGADFPSEAEYCYSRGVTLRQLKTHDALQRVRELMDAKRQAMMIRRGWSGDEPVGGFMTKLAANAGDHSLVDKHELSGPDGAPITLIKRVVVDGQGRPVE